MFDAQTESNDNTVKNIEIDPFDKEKEKSVISDERKKNEHNEDEDDRNESRTITSDIINRNSSKRTTENAELNKKNKNVLRSKKIRRINQFLNFSRCESQLMTFERIYRRNK